MILSQNICQGGEILERAVSEWYSKKVLRSAKPPADSVRSGEPAARMPYPVFLYTDYRTFLKTYCEFLSTVRGLRRRLAEAANCQPSYLSQVLQGDADFSIDQLHGVSTYLGLSDQEWDYFRELWLWSRAASQPLKLTIEKKLAALREQYCGAVGGPANMASDGTPNPYAKFTTSWHHSAIYVALEIPGVDNVAEIAKRLELRSKRVAEVLAELEVMKLAKQTNGVWSQTTSTFVMDRFSPTFQIHRMFWFMRSLQKFLENPKHGYHGGVCFAASPKQFSEIQHNIQQMVFEILKQPAQGDTRAVTYFNVDLFEV